MKKIAGYIIISIVALTATNIMAYDQSDSILRDIASKIHNVNQAIVSLKESLEKQNSDKIAELEARILAIENQLKDKTNNGNHYGQNKMTKN